ncbi:MAG: penicillin-binding transpeptidase domain-containing protein [Phycisphaerae bacterium]
MSRFLPRGVLVCASVVAIAGGCLAQHPISTEPAATSLSATTHPTSQPTAGKDFAALDASEIDLKRFFGDFDGCFVLVDEAAEKVYRYQPSRCAERLPPCSTFKIPNSLIGLEAGVVRDADDVYRWDGTEHPRKPLNRDHALRSAVAHSVLWYFQELAKRVGETQMQASLDKLDYGNRDMSGGLTTFWLSSSLRVSADEQVAFLMKLKHEQLPFAVRNQHIARDVIRQFPDGNLFGKTGSCEECEEFPQIGWFVGWVETERGNYFFATNIKGAKAWGYPARDIAREILKDRNIDVKEQ